MAPGGTGEEERLMGTGVAALEFEREPTLFVLRRLLTPILNYYPPLLSCPLNTPLRKTRPVSDSCGLLSFTVRIFLGLQMNPLAVM